eukprot:CAMPEP_0182942786 /NCGR_PEP_ID=MMETSP0105_2-20130417/51326_1 /TAXON_ID=81532 ORGANISM="Acanthoeca-like sp., Strain 10tr" /NCGR_SAMPLE_ID=MMETSP0105_2 /ASSEMBLY_ACC=CAM_ASM_000205 /LENGTH=220 /DNA_ID=CAMNT_0025082573 /DNA_START=189 /DNA_END=851 /DNA_ORIENTATION=-
MKRTACGGVGEDTRTALPRRADKAPNPTTPLHPPFEMQTTTTQSCSTSTTATTATSAVNAATPLPQGTHSGDTPAELEAAELAAAAAAAPAPDPTLPAADEDARAVRRAKLRQAIDRLEDRVGVTRFEQRLTKRRATSLGIVAAQHSVEAKLGRTPRLHYGTARRNFFDGGCRTNNERGAQVNGQGCRHQNHAVHAQPAKGGGKRAKWSSVGSKRSKPKK